MAMPPRKQEREPKSETITAQNRQEQESEEEGVRKVLLRQEEVNIEVLQRQEEADSEVLQEVSQNLQMPPPKQPGPKTKTIQQGSQLSQDQEDRMVLQRQREADRERERIQRQHDADQRNIKRKELAKALRWQHGI